MKKLFVELLKGILSTSCVIFSYPKLLSISVLTFIKWRLTPSYVAKDTKKIQNYRYQNYCPDDNIQIYSYGLKWNFTSKLGFMLTMNIICTYNHKAAFFAAKTQLSRAVRWFYYLYNKYYMGLMQRIFNLKFKCKQKNKCTSSILTKINF
jgi:hypothetical protein